MKTLEYEKCNSSDISGVHQTGRNPLCSADTAFLASKPKYIINSVRYKADGFTPDFSELFSALLKQEQEAPPLEITRR